MDFFYEKLYKIKITLEKRTFFMYTQSKVIFFKKRVLRGTDYNTIPQSTFDGK